jgi:hypothetical protein
MRNEMTTTWDVPGLPFTLSPSSGSVWTIDPVAATVTGKAAAHTDIFIDPRAVAPLEARSILNAATLLGVPPHGDFQFSTCVSVDFAFTYDAGVLILWIDDANWSKLCFEYSPAGTPMIVSVVTRGVSDDADAFVVDGQTVWLRVSRIGHAFAYHASLDGSIWRLIRYFALADSSTPPRLGFEVQSPTGDGCLARFGEIQFMREPLRDLRDGS